MRLGLIGLVLFAACTRRDEGPFREYYAFHFEGPPSDIGDAFYATQEWNDCDVVQATVAQDSGDIPITKVLAFDDPAVAGRCHSYPISIEYRDWPASRQAILAHEMGHAFGLQHYGQGLMNADLLANHVSPEDCEMLNNIHFLTPRPVAIDSQ